MHHGLVREVLERSLRTDPVVTAVGGVPDGEGTLESVAADGLCEQGEGAVRDTAVDVHAAVVRPAFVLVLHVRRLAILAELRIVVGGARFDHAAQRLALHLIGEETRADEPVVRRRRDVVAELVDQNADHVREVLVERAALVLVFQTGGVVRHAVSHLVTDDRADDELGEDDAVTVAVDHLSLVEERVVVALAVVATADQVETLVVERVALEDFEQEAADVAVELVGIVDEGESGVFAVALMTSLVAGETLQTLAVEDAAVALAGSQHSEAQRRMQRSAAGDGEALGDADRVDQRSVVGIETGDLMKQEGGNETVEVAMHSHSNHLVFVWRELRHGLKTHANKPGC